MTENIEGYDFTISITRFFMKLYGIWPGFSASKFRIARYSFLFSLLMTFIIINVPQANEIIQFDGDLNSILNTLMLADSISITFVKLVCIGYYQPVLHQLIVSITEDWKETEEESDLIIMWEKAKTIRRVSIILIALSKCTVFAYSVHITYNFRTALDKNDKKPLYMPGKFPYNEQISPNFEITWTLQIMATFLSAGSYASIDALFITLVLHLCGQLNILRNGFLSLGETEYKGEDTFMIKLGGLVDKHDRINQFLDVIDSSFNFMFLFQVFSSTVVICIQGYVFVMMTAGHKIEFIELIFMIYYSIWFILTIFIYSYVAELLREENNQLEYAVFYSGWFNLPAKEARLLILPLVRLKKPLEITAGKICVFSLNLFCNVIKTAATYVSMLLAVRDKFMNEEQF